MWFASFSSHPEDQGNSLTANGFPERFKGKGYVFTSQLEAAVDVAIGLERPLLVSGEPGCGKTELGFAIARRLGIQRLYVFSTKSNSEARDLFYTYDAIGRFRDAQIRGDVKRIEVGSDSMDSGVADYIEYEALGAAILDAHPADHVKHLLRGRRAYQHPDQPQRTLVIIDEIDKASRDFPNDILLEIEHFQFRVPELGRSAAGGSLFTPQTPPEVDRRYRPIVVITSNEERQLPDAFLRRCVFHEIQFPNPSELRQIVRNSLARRYERVGTKLDLSDNDLDALLDVLDEFRKRPVDKKAGISEMIDAAFLIASPTGQQRPPLVDRLSAAVVAMAKLKNDRTTLSGIVADHTPKS
jgi:MoxR-like ATPase